MMKLFSYIFLFILPTSVLSNDSLFHQGVLQLKNNEFTAASTTFEQFVLESPSYSGYYNLGISKAKLGDWFTARWAFEKALKYRPFDQSARHNAELASHKIDTKNNWTLPYSVLERVIVRVGGTIWIIFSILSSFSLGLLFYFIIIRNKKSSLRKWSTRLIFPLFILFLISTAGILMVNQHYNTNKFALLKNSFQKLYLSPNGLESKITLPPASRLTIENYFMDSTWMQVQHEKNRFWLKTNSVYRY